MSSLVRAAESPDNSPYLRLRVGRVVAVYADSDSEGIPSESAKPRERVLGHVRLEWADGYGKRELVPLTFPSFSNPVVSGGDQRDPDSAVSARCYGDVSMPSPGDLALVGFRAPESPVVLGYLPANYFQQTLDEEKPDIWGTMRRVKPGEFSRLSAQQAEIYQDRAGAVQIIVKAQPVDGSEADDGSATSKASDIDPATVPSAELARVIVGEAYQDDTFAARAVGASGSKLVLEARMASGAAVKIDAEGNIEVTAAPEKSITLNSGTKGVARLDDQVKSQSSDDSAFWNFVSALVDGLVNTATVPLDGGAAYKAGIVAKLAAVGVTSPQNAPQSLTGKVTASSATVKAGD